MGDDDDGGEEGDDGWMRQRSELGRRQPPNTYLPLQALIMCLVIIYLFIFLSFPSNLACQTESSSPSLHLSCHQAPNSGLSRRLEAWTLQTSALQRNACGQ